MDIKKFKQYLGDSLKDIEIIETNSQLNSISFYIEDKNSLVAKKLLDLLDENKELIFYDYYHPQLSDPGAYVTLYKNKLGKLNYYLGNHGWGSKSFPITDARAIRYINKNIEWNRTSYDSFSISTKNNKKSNEELKIERININRVKESPLLVNSTHVYEINDSYYMLDNQKNKGYYFNENIQKVLKKEQEIIANIDMLIDKDIKIEIWK